MLAWEDALRPRRLLDRGGKLQRCTSNFVFALGSSLTRMCSIDRRIRRGSRGLVSCRDFGFVALLWLGYGRPLAGSVGTVPSNYV